MRVQLKYGRTGLEVDVPDRNTDVIEPRHVAALPDESAAICAALEKPIGCPPLRALASADDRVVIVVSDGTRPMPRDRVLPPMLDALAHVPRDRITILVATGTRRANTPAELDEMLGPAIARGYRVVNHDARDHGAQVHLGTSRRGHPIWLNRLYVEATIKVLTGFIEPHPFAGFWGGPKAVVPGAAGLETVLHNHGPPMLADPRATFGVLDGNPIHEEMQEIALMTRPTFSLNVAINKHHEITGVWAGEKAAAHAAGVAFVRATAMQPIARLYDVVLATNGGFPLDQNLYQTSQKELVAAARAVRRGGAIVMAAECSDGLPAHGLYADILRGAHSPEEVLQHVEQPATPIADGWAAQLQAEVQQRASVYLYSSLPDAVAREALLEPCHDSAAQVRRLLQQRGPDASLLVLPQGPQTVCMSRGEPA
jgi:lactate racemase